MLKEHPQLQQLESISANVRPSDLSPNGVLYAEVERRLEGLEEEYRNILLRVLVIEVVEDEEVSADLADHLNAWSSLGFRLSYDDTIGAPIKQQHEHLIHLHCLSRSRRG